MGKKIRVVFVSMLVLSLVLMAGGTTRRLLTGALLTQCR